MIPLFFPFLLYHPIICAEEQFLSNKFGINAYQQKVPRYLPVFVLSYPWVVFLGCNPC